MKLKSFLPFIAVFIALISIIYASSVNQKNNAEPVVAAVSTSTNDSVNQIEEMKGIWISYMELSMENESDKSEKRFTEKIEEIINNCANLGFNTLIVQVRPFSDALYDSEYYPWSHILTGEQGKNPGYDPLKIICNLSHEKGLAVHAWINPYRISVSETPNELSADNIYNCQKEICFETENGIFLNPAEKSARELIINGVSEVVEKYDIDGIQFDDYFYPENMDMQDKNQYDEYCSSVNSELNISDWRKTNINILIADVYRNIHSLKDDVVFGISPQGNKSNNEKLYADIESWCTIKGYIDYICPQIYFSPENPTLGFEEALEDWCSIDFADGVSLYVGLAGYKGGSDADDGTWQNSDSILAEEYKIVSNNKLANGIMLYSYGSINYEESRGEIENLSKELN